MRRRLVALTLLLATFSACGRFVRSDEAREAPPPENAEVGAGVDVPAGSTTAVPTTAPRPGTPTAPAATTPGQPPTTALPANQSVFEHRAEGFRLTLTVAGSLRYSSSEDITLDVEVENISDQPLQYDPNDLRNFVLRPPGSDRVVWSDGNCRASHVPAAVRQRARTIGPKEHIRFTDFYPGPPEQANRDDCRVPPGTYIAFGFVTWCPPGSIGSNGMCDPGRTRQMASAGVRITIT